MDFKEFIRDLVKKKDDENLKKEIGLHDFDEKKAEDWINKMKKVADIIYENCVKGNENDYKKMSERLYEFLDSKKDEKEGKTFFKFNTDFREQKIGGLNKKLGELKQCDPITFYNLLIGTINRLKLLGIDLDFTPKKNPFGIPQGQGQSPKIFPFSEKDFENSWKLFLKIYEEIDDYSKDKEKIFSSEFKNLLEDLLNVKHMELVKLSQVLYLMKPNVFTALQNDGIDALKSKYEIKDFDIEYYIHTILDILHEEGVKLTRYPTIWFSKYIYIVKANKPSMDSLETLKDKIKDLLIHKKQVILYGPPGTGKTYFAKKFAEEFVNPQTQKNQKEELIKFITFHPSYSYEEFIEGIKPKAHGGKIVFKVEEGVFKGLCREAFNALLEKAKISDNEWKEGEGLPTLTDDKKKKVRELIKALDEVPKFLLIIDEINRGDISKIFGELITLLENDKRLFAENEVICELPYSKEKFGIPPNLYIIGTMNSTDRSIALVDIALRRRFRFVEIMPSYLVLLKELLNRNDVESEDKAVEEIEQWKFKERSYGDMSNEDLKKLAIKVLYSLNERIKEIYNRDYQIGHSYIIRLKDINDKEKIIFELKNIWYHEILPLLSEYFYENQAKLEEKVLNKASIVREIKDNETFINELKKITIINR